MDSFHSKYDRGLLESDSTNARRIHEFLVKADPPHMHCASLIRGPYGTLQCTAQWADGTCGTVDSIDDAVKLVEGVVNR